MKKSQLAIAILTISLGTAQARYPGYLESSGTVKSGQTISLTKSVGKQVHCDPMRLGAWLADKKNFSYRVQRDNPTSDILLLRGHGDCKAYMRIATEVLKSCGLRTHSMQLSQPGLPGHVIAIFTDKLRRPGFISGSSQGVQYKIYKAHTLWSEILKDVGNGKWEAVATDGKPLDKITLD